MKKMPRIIELLQNISLSLIVLIIIGSGTLQCYGQENLAQNASFEEIKGGKSAIDWWFCGSFLKSQKGSGASLSSEGAHSGQHSVMIDGKECAAWISKSQVKVKPGATYRLSAWIKSDGVEGKGAAVQALQFCENRHITTTNSQFVNAKSEWQKFTVDFTLKSNINKLQLRLLCDGVGKVYFDDITLQETSGITGASSNNPVVDAKQGSEVAMEATPLKSGSFLIDSGRYPNSFAASAAWGPQQTAGNAALPAEAAIVDGVACVRLPCGFQDSGT
ncbi:MAG: carbohydrate binding domain-containing protein, partial [Phycisphaeraceae bacterium]|nr:carbohydrate binding domain-containing protein [Phycisphaeraceae bacterium]